MPADMNIDVTAISHAIVTLVLMPIALWLVRYLRGLSNVRFTEQEVKDQDRAIENGILWAEEQALKAWKEHQALVPGPEKLQAARKKAREFSRTGLASVPEPDLTALVEARVNSMRPMMSTPPPASSLRPPVPRISLFPEDPEP